MIITDKDINDGIRAIDGYQLECFADAGLYCGGPFTLSKLDIKRKAVEVLLESMRSGPGRWRSSHKCLKVKIRREVAAQVRKDCGLSILTYITIARMIFQMAPILWKWWRERQAA